ncbi:MAG: UPF0149 family protein [Desulforhopalus sp.]
MLTTKIEEQTLKNLLKLAPEPDFTFTYNELMGFMFGLGITPDVVLPSEWLPIIFGGEMPVYDSMEQMQEMTECLMQVYNKFTASSHAGTLSLPFHIEKLNDKEIEILYEWVSGLEEALALREELWDPEEFPNLPNRRKEELYHAMMTIQGLVDPMEAMDYFDALPDELFAEIFSPENIDADDREYRIQLFLLASLPQAVATFQEHGQELENKRRQQVSASLGQSPLRSNKVGRNEPCPCKSGKKYKKCCGAPSKKSNVIKVDFPQHGPKKSHPAVPVYQLKIGLQGAKPPIWRRIHVPGQTTLEQLHTIIQLTMGWDDCHLHQFVIDRTCYSLPDDDHNMRTSRPKNEAQYTLDDLADKIHPRFQYIYDFGDNWLHQITVEKTLSPGQAKPYPVLLTGRRTCPPEDSGGVHGYQHLLAILEDPDSAGYDDTIDWLGEDFDPASFGKDDITAINIILQELLTPPT